LARLAGRTRLTPLASFGEHPGSAVVLPRISVDFPTARRLFTLVCSLYWKG